MKKTNKFLIFYISLGFIFIILPIYLLFFLETGPDEYKKYDSGLTIVVNNLSNQSLPDLKFSYSGNQTDFQEVGTIKSLKAGETTKITGSTKVLKYSDMSLYLNYYIEDGEKKEDSILYFYTKKPIKAVAILNIHEVNSDGYLKYELSGYNGWSQFGPEEIKSDN